MSNHTFVTACSAGVIAAAVIGAVNIATAATWDDGAPDHLWSSAANWNPDGVPTTSDDANLSGTSSAAHVLLDSAAVANSVQVSSSSDGYLDIQNDLAVTGDFAVGYNGDGHVVHSAGTLTAANFWLNNGTGAFGHGTYDLTGTGRITISGAFQAQAGDSTGAIFTQNGAATVVHVGSITSDFHADPAKVRWTYNLVSGSLQVDSSVGCSEGGWYFNQTGGTAIIGGALGAGRYPNGATQDGEPMEWKIAGAASLSVTGDTILGWDHPYGGTSQGNKGRFTLDGSKTGSGTDVTIGGKWYQTSAATPGTNGNSLGTLKALIDQDAINNALNMRKIVVTGNAIFDDGSILDPGFASSVTPAPGTWTLMTWGGSLTDNGLELAAGVDPNWSFNFDTLNKALTVTYIPEPATLALMSLGATVIVRRRRTRG